MFLDEPIHTPGGGTADAMGASGALIAPAVHVREAFTAGRTFSEKQMPQQTKKLMSAILSWCVIAAVVPLQVDLLPSVPADDLSPFTCGL